jgi:nucleotide-binding universal stress UspA family protein
VVGVDGSRSALIAVSWATEEAVSRGVPLRLVAVVDQDPAPGVEAVLRHAVSVAESEDERVKADVEILHGRPADQLLQTSREAAMLCIGAVGTAGATSGRLGSTAVELAALAHCPVAIIRGSSPFRAQAKSIVVELDSSPGGDGLLQLGVGEALLRHAPLVVISVWRPSITDLHDTHAVAEQNRRIRAQVNRRLACTRRRHPELDVQPVTAHGTLLNYLSHHASSIQLVLVGRRRARGVAEMIGLPSHAALHNTDCSVLVCDQHGTL